MDVTQPDPDSAPAPAGRDGRTKEQWPGDFVESAVRKIVTAIVLAGAIIALAVYARPAPPRYQAVVGDGKIVRIDMTSGTMIACEGDQCATVLRRGQHLQRHLEGGPPPAQEADPPPARIAPPPAAAPAGR